MSFNINDSVLCSLLPADGAAAEASFLQFLNQPEELWMIAYGFTLPAMMTELLAAHAAGVKQHIYLDHSQEVGSTEKPEVAKLIAAGLEITIGTSTAGSAFICHDKAAVKANGQCFVGSCNFSQSGWKQVNAIFQFTDDNYATALATQLNQLVDYAWKSETQFQLLKSQPAPSPFIT